MIKCSHANCDKAAEPNGRCGKHGGRLYARSSQRARSRYLQRLAPRIAEFFETSIQDQRQLDGTEIIALFDARIMDLLEQMKGDGDGPEFRQHAMLLWQNAKNEFHRLADAQEELPANFEKLGEWIENGCIESATWRELLDVAKKRQERAEAQVGLMLKGENSISAKDFTLLLGEWMKTIMDVCGKDNRDIAKRILAELAPESVQDESGPLELQAPGERSTLRELQG